MGILPRCDVLVAGGGPAGRAAAIALAERRLDILIVDKASAAPALKRCEMLPAGAETIAKRLGIDDMLAASVPLIGTLSRWGEARPLNLSGLSPQQVPVGKSVDRALLDATLRARTRHLNVPEYRARVTKVSGGAGHWQVALSDGTVVNTSYLIDATGRPAKVAREIGAVVRFGAPLVAHIWNTADEMPPRLLVEAQPDGWSYALPRATGGGSIGYVTLTKNSAGIRSPLPELFPALTLERARAQLIVDSRCSRLFPTVDTGWLATGDAAAGFDPVASQGLFNALSGGFFAGQAAADCLEQNDDSAQIYGAMIARAAARTHRLIPQHYASRPFDTLFWTRLAEQLSVFDWPSD